MVPGRYNKQSSVSQSVLRFEVHNCRPFESFHVIVRDDAVCKEVNFVFANSTVTDDIILHESSMSDVPVVTNLTLLSGRPRL